MGISFDLVHVDKIGAQAQAYFSQHVLSWAMAAQIAVIGCTLLLARKVSGFILLGDKSIKPGEVINWSYRTSSG
jgi:hypothetical protein